MNNETAFLATDLDGTFIPLEGHPENLADLSLIGEAVEKEQLHITFVTGRHLESVLQAMDEYQLPRPEWILCDVGASIYHLGSQAPRLLEEYSDHLRSLTGNWNARRLRDVISSLDGMELQEEEKQNEFKLSYYADAQTLSACFQAANALLKENNIPWNIISSVDPFDGRGLIDFLPQTVSKAYALQWWADFCDIPTAQLIFSGDSGNDLAALEHGFRAIVVGNASREVAHHAFWTHQNQETADRLFLAQQKATSGVLEGLRWFDALPGAPLLDDHLLGVQPLSVSTSRVSVWAPGQSQLNVRYLPTGTQQWQQQLLEPDRESGVFQATVPAGPGSQYCFVLDNQQQRPDPRSQWQPGSVHEASQIVNSSYPWLQNNWPVPAKQDLVVYELHVGTFTEAGTYEAAEEHLDRLIDLGVTAIELLPLAQCPGRWNWGYDGVFLFAPNRHYGSPQALRRFIDTCHGKGLAVLLDVVYNHLGPEGNYLSNFGPYFTNRHATPWGDALNYDGSDSQQTRKLMVDNALYWLREYRFDGLRLDAIHFMFDDSEYPITQEICDAVREYEQDSGRVIHLIGEANIYDRELIDRQEGNVYGAIWADCLMHSIYSHGVPEVQLTPRNYTGAQDIAETLGHGFIYQGPILSRAERTPESPRSTNAQQLSSLIMALQTHDSVGNHPHGKRLHQLTNLDFQAAAIPLFLLYPAIPMIFMGEELATDSPFCFFADFLEPKLRKAVDRGRQHEYPNHQWKGATAPSDPAAFYDSKLDHPGQTPEMFRWYQSLLTIRKAGLQDGWLKLDHLAVQFDSANHHFQLNYQTESQLWTIECQLLAPTDSDRKPMEFPKLPAAAEVANIWDSWDALKHRTGHSRAIIRQRQL